MSYLDYLMDDESATGAMKNLQDSLKRGGGSNNVWFRYRTVLDFGQSCTIRFLPASEENASGPFWLPKKLIRLKFADPVNVGQDVNLNIPVMQMYTGGKASDDLILGQVTRLYEEADSLEKRGESEKAKQVRSKASYHYIKGESIAQGFVISSPPEKDVPANPIRLFELNKQIVKIINAQLETENPELKLDFWPCHGKKGSNFIINKGRTGDGKYASYNEGTGFSKRTTPLSDEQIAAIQEHGPWNLDTFLPHRPTDEEYSLLAQIVEQSIAGNRIWDSDWEIGFKTVKVYRTARANDGDEPAELQDQVKEQLARLTAGKATTASTTSEGVLAALSRTTHTTEDATVDEDTEATVVAKPEQAPTKSATEVQSIVDKIKRNQTKTATANG